MSCQDVTRLEHEKAERDARFRDEALRWLPEVTRYALSLTRDETNAEDLVQETFLRAYRAWDQYVAGTECRGWLFTICRHTYLRTHSRERRQIACDDPELEALAAAALHTSAVQGGYGDLFATVDLADAVDRALARLPDEFREAIILVDLEDQSYAVASGILRVPVGTVRSRLFRGRRLLQEALLAYARDAGLVRDASDRPPGWDLDR
jgi:RNA polymerase sigma-70 factor (ECF subfamily)